MKSITNIKYSDFEECTLDLYLPEHNNFPVFVYFHGGGIENGDKNEYTDILCKPLVERGIAVANVNYRMYPKAKYPEFIDDTAVASAWVHKHIMEYGNCTKIFVGGSSAGGYLTQMIFFDKTYLEKYGCTPNDFDGFIFDAGQPTTHFNVLRERGVDTRRVIIDEAAPIYHIEECSGNHPEILIIFSEHDMPNRPEQTRLMYNTMKIFGYKEEKMELKYIEGSQHCEYVFPKDGKEEEFIGMVSEYINRKCK